MYGYDGRDNAAQLDEFYIAAANGFDLETGEVFDRHLYKNWAGAGHPTSWRSYPTIDLDIPKYGCRRPQWFEEENQYQPCGSCAWCVPPDVEIIEAW